MRRHNAIASDLNAVDLVVLEEMLRFGALTVEQIARRYGVPGQKQLPQLKNLVEHGYAIRQPDFPSNIVFYMAAHRAAYAVRGDMRELKRPPAHPDHDLTVVNLADWLLEQHPGAKWLTEREIKHERPRSSGWGKPEGHGHPPDGALLLDGRRIGIELERRFVTEAKYASVCRWYSAHAEYSEVRWYVLSDLLSQRIPSIVRRHGLEPDIQILTLPIPREVEVIGWRGLSLNSDRS